MADWPRGYIAIRQAADPARSYHFMEFCGGHTHAISRYGVSDLLPDNVRMIHGPGCPVCVLPVGRVDMAIRLALECGVILCTYGDTLRVPASDSLSLMKAKARGGDIRMVYSSADALKIAQANPEKQVVFFAIGFETTTPPTAVAIKQAQALGLKNFSVLSCHVLTPSAISNILESPKCASGAPCRSTASSARRTCRASSSAPNPMKPLPKPITSP
jgi:hydrogenase expression/formation protein HypD